mgnify:CR=1 FL=1
MTNDPIKRHFKEAEQRAVQQAKDPQITPFASDFFTKSHQLQYS